jgi:iron complex outermembrane receptor protein
VGQNLFDPEHAEYAGQGAVVARQPAAEVGVLMTSTLRLRFLLVLFGLAVPSPGLTQSGPPNLNQMSIEDLMRIEITSASRKEERASDVAAAVFVITQDDIRRSGMTTIPDLLRLAPGVQVAQINANKWAVSVRGFNAFYANKLLVLVDGRSLYNKMFSGVLWDSADVMVDDIDRIEVIRGPGAAMWGANAVNGVINIVTRATADTQGGLVRADGGGWGEQGAIRYGGTHRAVTYRVFAQGTDRGESLIAPGTGANDNSYSATMGFRADWTTPPGTFTVEGTFKAGQTRALWLNLDPQTVNSEPINHDYSGLQGGHLLGRWTLTRPSGATLQVQSFVDLAARQETVGDYHRKAFDVETQYHTALGTRHDLVAGGSYRFIGETFDGHVGLSLTPAQTNSSLLTAFLQDEIALFDDRVTVTLGTQVQHDSYSGGGVQPTARVMWKVRPRQRLWAATSGALRTPSLTDRGIRVDYPPVPTASGLPLIVTVRGNPAAETEHLLDAEAGYRLDLGTTASIDVTGYVGRYDNLWTQEVAAPIVQFVPSPHLLVATQFGNELRATTRGLEVAGHWNPVPAWRLDGSYSAFHVTPRLAATSQDPRAATDDGATPRTQWQVRSAFAPHPRATVEAAIFHVGRLEQFQIDAYTRADVTAEWRFTSSLSAMAIGQNLFDAAHPEFAGTTSLLLATQVPRSVSLRLRWAFQ